MGVSRLPAARQVRALFLSDVHLGYRGCRADFLLDFLRAHDAATIYLLGDIIDIWALRRSVYWPEAHQQVLRLLRDRSRDGARIVYVPGNHDELLRDAWGTQIGNCEIVRDVIHETADGRRLLLLHGDEFDAEVRASAALRWLGATLYDFILSGNHLLHRLQRRLGFGYWSLADWLKHQAPQARDYVRRFENACANAARKRGVDGIVCGHIHRAAIRDIDGILYCNDGDWVENCTALVEERDGQLSLLRWTQGGDVVDQAAPSLRQPLRAA